MNTKAFISIVLPQQKGPTHINHLYLPSLIKPCFGLKRFPFHNGVRSPTQVPKLLNTIEEKYFCLAILMVGVIFNIVLNPLCQFLYYNINHSERHLVPTYFHFRIQSSCKNRYKFNLVCLVEFDQRYEGGRMEIQYQGARCLAGAVTSQFGGALLWKPISSFASVSTAVLSHLFVVLNEHSQPSLGCFRLN